MKKTGKNGLVDLFERYWRAYGGWKTVTTSPYSIFSLVFAAILYPLWIDDRLIEIAINVLPSLLGFTLGGYAMFLAFGDRDFLQVLIEPTKEGHPIYRSINSTFVHFIVVQIVGLLWALFLAAYFVSGTGTTQHLVGFDLVLKILFVFPGAFLFIYALVLALAVTMNLFRFTTWYEKALSAPPKDEDRKGQ